MTVTCHGTRNYADAIKVPNKLTTKKGIILDEPVLNKETIRDLKEWETPWTEQPGRGQSAESQSNGEYLHVQHPSPSTEETSKVISELRLTVVPAFLCPRDWCFNTVQIGLRCQKVSAFPPFSHLCVCVCVCVCVWDSCRGGIWLYWQRFITEIILIMEVLAGNHVGSVPTAAIWFNLF